MRKRRFNALHLIVAVFLTLVLALGGGCLAAWSFIGSQGVTLLTGLRIINRLFVGDYEEQEAVDSAMTGMVEGLGDRWSYYLDAGEYQNTQAQQKNVYVGIGVTVLYSNPDGLQIKAVEPDGPADQAGIQAGELILSVDGNALAGEEQGQNTTLIQGAEGTKAILEIRGVDGIVRSVEVIRGRVEVSSVSYELLSNQMGYLQVKNFYDHSADGVKAAVEDLISQGAKALVFDMRNNGGGFLRELTAMLDYLLPEGAIFRSKTRSGEETVIQSDASCIDLPMAILVNKDTYSAAEFFGAELREWGRGVIVGEETSGKGYSQQTYPLPNGGAVGVSTAAYFTGKGTSLIGTGVTLDKVCSLSEEENQLLWAGTLSHEEDAQLQAALELLK